MSGAPETADKQPAKAKESRGSWFGGRTHAPDASAPLVTEEGVRWAYRLFLDREPENPGAVAGKLRHPDLASLRAEFLGSPEFSSKHPGASNAARLTGAEPARVIECDGEPGQLAQLFEHVEASWRELGEVDPYYSVLTSPQYKGLPSDSIVETFFESGKSEAQRFQKALERCGKNLDGRPTCLEFGCGLGRVTQALAPLFDSVTAVDISSAHLALAQQHAIENAVHGIQWRHLEAISALEDLPQVDVVYSIIVLQHNPPPVIDRIVATFARILKPGGIAYFQVPTYRSDYEFRLADYLREQMGVKSMEMHAFPQSRIFRHFAENSSVPVSVVEDGYTGRRAGERSNTFIFERVR